MVLATEMVSNGGKVTALLDENNLKKKLGFLPYAMDHWPKLMEGGFHMGRMALARIPLHQGVRVIEAVWERKTRPTRAGSRHFCSNQRQRRCDPRHGKRPMKPRSLCMGYGFVPNIELPIQAGCDTVYDKNKGGWVIQVDDRLETSVPSVFAAGEITGIAGAKKSHVEGTLAALSILERYNVSVDNVWDKTSGGQQSTFEQKPMDKENDFLEIREPE